MADTRRPLSPHLQIYKWQVQMVTSILHRATGVALSAGTLLVLWGLLAVAAGPEAYAGFKKTVGSLPGLILLFGWSWALFYHFCNGIRHLLQDGGMGYAKSSFVRSSWLSLGLGTVLTVLVWGCVLSQGGLA